jgi:hypothetical protein
LADIVKAIEHRVSLQKKSGTFKLAPGEKLQLCSVADKGGEYTSLGVVFGCVEKRNSPNAMLYAAAYKGDESRRNFEIFFGGNFYLSHFLHLSKI